VNENSSTCLPPWDKVGFRWGDICPLFHTQEAGLLPVLPMSTTAPLRVPVPMKLSRRDLISSSAALAAVASGATLASAQGAEDPVTPPTAEEDILAQLQGAWVLRELDSPDFREQRRQEKAFMVIGGTFLAIDIQLAWDAKEGDEWINGFFQSGISRIWVERSNILIARGLIGVTTDEDYGLEIESPGRERRYTVRFQEKNELVLNMEDGPRFAFKRLQNGGVRHNASSRTEDSEGR